MKRYLLFAHKRYYAKAGWEDFKGSFDWIVQAEAAFDPEHGEHSHAHVVDTTTETIVRVWGGYDYLGQHQNGWHAYGDDRPLMEAMLAALAASQRQYMIDNRYVPADFYDRKDPA